MKFYLYKTRLKCLLRNKENMFWTFVFPIALASCFFFAFNNLWSVESFETIDIAYVSEASETDPLQEALEQAEIEKGTRMFQVTHSDREEAGRLLEEKEIEAFIIGGVQPELHIRGNGLNQTIIKSFLDNYNRILSMYQTVAAQQQEADSGELMKDLMQTDNFVEELKDDKKPDASLIYFYALMALTCLFSVNAGLDEVVNVQADQSNRGARVNVSPVHKMKLFLNNILAAFTIHMFSILLLFVYMQLVLGVDFGNNLVHIFINCFVGSLTGIFLGATVGVWVRKKASVKSAILTSAIMGGSFLSGMMYADMKYIIATKAPLLGYINPVNLVSDSFYSLYYYNTYEHFYLNIAILCAMVAVMGALSYLGLRRKTYASI